MLSGLISKYEINADMGEGYGRWKLARGPDEELMKYIDVANIACGFHAGDPSIMLNTVRLCKKYGVKAGAHPGLQDLFGFGRRRIIMDPKDLYAMILYQVGSLKSMLESEGMELSHIKPHGELFYYMQDDEAIMRACLEACAVFNVPVYASKNQKQQAMCDALGITFQEEVYVDIDYAPSGALLSVPKSNPVTPELCASRIRQMANSDQTTAIDGNPVKLGFDGRPFSVCIHSDMPTALDNVKGVRKAIDETNKMRGLPVNYANGHVED